MTSEIKGSETEFTFSDNFPDKFKHLYELPTATKVVLEAISIVEVSSSKEQEEFLANPAFTNIVSQAIVATDQRRKQVEERVVNSFDENLREQAKEALVSEITDFHHL